MKTIYIDCSYLCHHPESHTGIQRVVRKVVENFSQLAQGQLFDVVPVDLADGRMTPIPMSRLYVQDTTHEGDPQPPVSVKRALLTETKIYLKTLYFAIRALLVAVLPQRHFKRFLLAPRAVFGLNYLIDKALILPAVSGLTFVRTGSWSSAAQQQEGKAQNPFDLVSSEDILLLLDSTWSVDIWPSVENIKARGAGVVAVIYDLIPITHPQFCVDELVTLYKRWFYRSLTCVDGYVAISDTVKLDLMNFLGSYFETKGDKLGQLQDRQFDYFLLGGDHSHSAYDESQVRSELKQSLSEGSSYLVVSTVEPRKNHPYLLDTFDLLWEQGSQAKLFIVGREGWKVADTMARINSHEQKDNLLFHWGDLNDSELLYCYQKSKMLVFPSFVEGFGLPIVESLNNQLPVMASDTPIHREVGGDQIGYFELTKPQDLANKILAIEENGVPEAFKPQPGYQWLSWRQSSQSLLEKVQQMAR